MAKKARKDAVVAKTPAEINFARRLIEKHSLKPPVDIFVLAKEYADLEKILIPFDVDGITLDLKVSGRRPRILLNAQRTERRQRFTLAHELGHVVIPWHTGSIADIAVDPKNAEGTDDYWFIEAEANRFASELLMPTDWVRELIKEDRNPRRLTEAICEGADVSPIAATIKLIALLPPGYVYAQLEDGQTVISASRSERTFASPPQRRQRIVPESLFPSAKKTYRFRLGTSEFFWWRFPTEINLPSKTDSREWRELLDGIVGDAGLTGDAAKKIKGQLNGTISYANSSVKVGGTHTQAAVYSATLQRLQSKPEFATLMRHPNFEAFLVARISELASD